MGYFPKYDELMTNTLFAFQNLLHCKKRCAVPWCIFQSTTRIGDKDTFCLPKLAPPLCFLASDAGEALSCLPGACVAGRESWKGAAPDGAASLEPFQAQAAGHEQEPLGKWSQGKSRVAPATSLRWAREPGHEGGLGGARAAGKNRAKGLRGAMTRGCAQCYRGQAATPGGHPWAHPGSLESFLPPDAGHEGHLRGAGVAGTWPAWPKGALARVRAQRCKKKKKTPRDTR